ncbi:hypothetical protein ACE193_15725 [Bernardetia sp. OM2101]|uniref:hypothetical protein n=1 Tax=Bernardetia sp. OM2101 TaxID=3344876 RepID=UPI0035CF484C
MNLISFKSILIGAFLVGTFASCGGEKKEETQEETVETEVAGEVTGELSLTQTKFKTGEPINVTFKVNQKLDKHPWIGIIPSEIPHGDESKNDQHDVSYKYFDNQESGTLEFYTPKKAGKYDFRMHSSDNNGVEITSVSFEVEDANTSEITGELSLERTTFTPGEKIMLTFKVSQKLDKRPWIGIIPSEIEHGDESRNDMHDVSYKYFDNQENGVIEFMSPTKEGKYDFRMHSSDNNGVEITSVSFEVAQ